MLALVDMAGRHFRSGQREWKRKVGRLLPTNAAAEGSSKKSGIPQSTMGGRYLDLRKNVECNAANDPKLNSGLKSAFETTLSYTMRYDSS
jgi:hypothetical protein